MEEVTKEQRQAARKRAWRKNNHSGGENKASQHQKSDLDEPIQCKMPPEKENEGEETVPEPVPCKMPPKKYDKGEKIGSEPVQYKMPSKKSGKGKR